MKAPTERLLRPCLGWGLALFALGLGLCWTPLFNLLGFEFSFALGLPAAAAAAHLGLRLVRRQRAGAPRSDREGADAHPLRSTTRLALRAAGLTWLLLLAPLSAISLNALRIRNCDPAAGLGWFLILPGCSALTGAATGVIAGLATDRRPRLALPLIWAALLSSVGLSIWRVYSDPPIFAFDPFGGYFPGSLYDEGVAITTTVLTARGYHLVGIAAALAMGGLFLDGERFGLRLRAARGRWGALGLTGVACALVTLLYLWSPRLGLRLDAEDLGRALGAERRTEHFVLHYSPRGPFAKDIALHAEDHEFRWSRLSRQLGSHPEGPIHSYLFDSPGHKRALMGAAHTSIAKPWRREMYLHPAGYPHDVLEHELAHVFAGAFGDPLLGTARRGLAFNVGLIEGVAVALAWQGPLVPHQTVRVLRLQGLLPPLAQVMSARFLGLNAARAYAVAGSFCRFLLLRHGPERLQRLYRSGGGLKDYPAIYGASLQQLEAEWLALVDATPLDDRQRAIAHERLSRPSVFHKTCAHALAVAREAGHAAAAAGRYQEARATLEGVCAAEPDDPENVAQLMDLARAARHSEEAAAAAARLRRHPKVSPPLLGRAEVLLADLALERGDRPTAAAGYAAALALPLDEGTVRLISVKRLAAERQGAAADTLVRFLLEGGRDAALDLLATRELADAAPEDGLYRYLYGRQLFNRGRFAAAAGALAAALGQGLPDSRFTHEALRLRGIAEVRAGHYDAAAGPLQRLFEEGSPGLHAEAAEWLDRARFLAARKAAASLGGSAGQESPP